jgi:hypothetical protein
MANENLNQIFTANPIITNASTDLMYFMQSPYNSGTDAGMTYANFAAQFGAPFTPAALTETDDTNVTLTLGGTPATALLHAVSITAGWTGTLSVERGGTDASTASDARSNLGAAASGANGDITSMTGLTGSLGAPTEILDGNGNIVLQFTDQASAVNYLQVTNAPVNENVLISSAGSSANISINLRPKGGIVELSSADATVSQLQLFAANGTDFTGLQPSSSSTDIVFTLPFEDGLNGYVMTTNGSGVLSLEPASGGGPFTQSGSYSAYGPSSNSTVGTSSLVLGNSAVAGGDNSLAVGASASAAGDNSLAVGASASADGSSSVALGNGAVASGNGCINISGGSAASISATGAIAIGANGCGSEYGVALGGQSNCGSGAGQICIGNGASAANGNYVISMGRNATAYGNQSICIGYGATNSGSNDGVFIACDSNGAPAADTAANQWVHTFAGGFFLYQNSTTQLAKFTPTGSSIIGTTTNNNATAGYVGEFVSSVILEANKISLTSTVTADITSISLTAGDWDVWSNASFDDSASDTEWQSWCSDTSATLPDYAYVAFLSALATAGVGVNLTNPYRRFSLSTTTTIYLSANITFASGTVGAYGTINARRAR